MTVTARWTPTGKDGRGAFCRRDITGGAVGAAGRPYCRLVLPGVAAGADARPSGRRILPGVAGTASIVSSSVFAAANGILSSGARLRIGTPIPIARRCPDPDTADSEIERCVRTICAPFACDASTSVRLKISLGRIVAFLISHVVVFTTSYNSFKNFLPSYI